MPRKNIIWIAAILAAAAVTIWVTRQDSMRTSIGGGDDGGLRPVRDAYRLIEENYLGRIEERRIYSSAVEGLVRSLDKWSTYVPPEFVASFQRHMDGREVGLGLRFEVTGEGVFVRATMVDSSAHQEGVAVGDEILAVGGKAVAGKTHAEVAALLGGRTARLTIRSVGQVHTVGLVRREFEIETVTGLFRDRTGEWVHLLEAPRRIAYVRIKEFVKNTGPRFKDTLWGLAAPAALVLDLRDNPGGTWAAALEVADQFLADGLIVRTIDRSGSQERHFAHKLGAYEPIPLVVLIDARTASAAEIVAGSLRRRDRAVLIGTPTLGKNCIQKMLTLADGLGHINLTTKRFHLADEEIGPPADDQTRWRVQPHHYVAGATDAGELARLRALAEAWPRRAPAPTPASLPEENISQRLLSLDPPLARAVELLANPARVPDILRRAAAERARQKARAHLERTRRPDEHD